MHHDVIVMSLLYLVTSRDVKDEFSIFSHVREILASNTTESYLSVLLENTCSSRKEYFDEMIDSHHCHFPGSEEE